MAALKVFLSLTICLLLGHQTFAINDAPCQSSQLNNSFATFVKRHIRGGLPNTDNLTEWEIYIRNNSGCDRPTQSFLQPDELDRVKAVCTKAGGKLYEKNMCISNQNFTFVTVRIESGNCSIRNVSQENKHLILACDKLENQCLPVHFEGNPENVKPQYNAESCRGRSFKMSWLHLILLSFVAFYLF